MSHVSFARAPASGATCRLCGERIAKGTVRVRIRGWNLSVCYHGECLKRRIEQEEAQL